MNGALIFYLLLAFPCWIGLLIATVAYAILLLRDHSTTRQQVGIVLGGVTLILIGLMSVLLAQSPLFDFIDRCGPNGIGGCGSGPHTPDDVRAAIAWEYMVSWLQCIGVPLLIGGGLGVVAIRRQKARQQLTHEAAQPEA